MDKYAELGELLFGGGADELVSKLSPEKKEKRHQTLQNVAIGTNVVGGVAGPAALYSAARSAKNNQGGIPRDIANAATNNKKIAGTKTGKKIKRGVDYVGSGFTRNATKGQRRAAVASGAGLVGLQAINWGGDVLSAKLLNDQKKKEQLKKNYQMAEHNRLQLKRIKAKGGKVPMTPYGPADRIIPRDVSKSEPGSSDIHIPNVGTLKRKAAKKGYEKVKPVATRTAKRTAGNTKAAALNGGAELEQYGTKVYEKVKKNEVVWQGEFSKVNTDKRQVFGWASIVEVDGEPVVDLQGDYIDIDEVEKSAYDYVVKSRKGGDMHRRDGAAPMHVSDMIESFIVTPEKREKMGLPDSVPSGWWVGYQINDDEAWNLVKSGKRTGFSIHGRGQRTPDVL